MLKKYSNSEIALFPYCIVQCSMRIVCASSFVLASTPSFATATTPCAPSSPNVYVLRAIICHLSDSPPTPPCFIFPSISISKPKKFHSGEE